MVSLGIPAPTKAITNGNPLSSHKASSPEEGAGPEVVAVVGNVGKGVGGAANVVGGPAAFGSPVGAGNCAAATGLGGALAAMIPPAIALAAIAIERVKRTGTCTSHLHKTHASKLSPKWQQV